MKKRIERNTEDKVVGGVLSGLADYFKQDPVLFRIVAIVLFILTGFFPIFLIYLVAWVIIPPADTSTIDYEIVS